MNHMKHRPYMAIQMKEVFGHQEYIKRTICSDVTIDLALHTWVDTKRAESFPERFDSHGQALEELCISKCGDVNACKGIYDCPASREYIHALLYDRI